MTSRAPNEPAARGTRKALVEAQIFEAATDLFAERGFAGTSLQDIAAAAGLTRPALYHYFASKEDLLSRLVSTTTEGPAADLRRIRRRDASCVDRLRAMAASIVERQARHPARFRVLIRSEADLPEALAKPYAAGRRSVLREFTALIDEGIGTGEFRALDARTASFGIIGLCNWVAWWHKPGTEPGGEAEIERIVAQLSEMAVATVVSTDTRAPGRSGVGRALDLLKQDVAALERLLPDAN